MYTCVHQRGKNSTKTATGTEAQPRSPLDDGQPAGRKVAITHLDAGRQFDCNDPCRASFAWFIPQRLDHQIADGTRWRARLDLLVRRVAAARTAAATAQPGLHAHLATDGEGEIDEPQERQQEGIHHGPRRGGGREAKRLEMCCQQPRRACRRRGEAVAGCDGAEWRDGRAAPVRGCAAEHAMLRGGRSWGVLVTAQVGDTPAATWARPTENEMRRAGRTSQPLPSLPPLRWAGRTSQPLGHVRLASRHRVNQVARVLRQCPRARGRREADAAEQPSAPRLCLERGTVRLGRRLVRRIDALILRSRAPQRSGDANLRAAVGRAGDTTL